jgi:osmoprotectant transport system ATP-binding protein
MLEVGLVACRVMEPSCHPFPGRRVPDSATVGAMATDRGPSAIALRGVTKQYPGAPQPAVTALDLDIPEGELVALVGPSGCGKTTTLKMVNRLVEPTSGTIEVLGESVTAVPAPELRRRIGYVIQDVGLFPHRTVAANIGTVPELLGWSKVRIAARAAELAELVGLAPDLLRRYPAALSGGQQQRVGVARALAADPPVLLMDEPFSAVDPIVRTQLQDDLRRLQEEVHKTIVFVTHDIDEALKLADRVAVLNVGGVLEQYAPPVDLLRAPASEFVARFLGRERGLRRLALLTVADVAWLPGPPTADGPATTVTPATPLRETLDQLLTAPGRAVAVVAADGAVLGHVTVDSIAGALA